VKAERVLENLTFQAGRRFQDWAGRQPSTSLRKATGGRAKRKPDHPRDYHRGNRLPRPSLNAERKAGKLPLEITFDASASHDPDGGPLKFTWISVMGKNRMA
jgi:hypothetical protein